MRASFMPKTFESLTGNGCHIHCSVWDADGKNVFVDGERGDRLSKTGFHFIGGLLRHGSAICALTNPSVNSYKRLNADGTASGVTWVPRELTYSGDDRTHAIRIPADDRIEFRVPDGSVNPYLLQLGVLAAGMTGIVDCTEPGHGENPLPESARERRMLPTNLSDALDRCSRSDIVKNYVGVELIESFVTLRTKQWNEYAKSVSEWELQNTLDC